MSTPLDDDFDNDLLQESLGKTLIGSPMGPGMPGLAASLLGGSSGDVSAPQQYMEIHQYPGHGGFLVGHAGISLDGGRSYGLEPIPGQDGVSAALRVPGYVQSIPKERQAARTVRIPATTDQVAAVHHYTLSNPGSHDYALTGPNCVTFIQDALRSAGIADLDERWGMTPGDLLEGFDQIYGKPHLIDTRPTLPKY